MFTTYLVKLSFFVTMKTIGGIPTLNLPALGTTQGFWLCQHPGKIYMLDMDLRSAE